MAIQRRGFYSGDFPESIQEQDRRARVTLHNNLNRVTRIAEEALDQQARTAIENRSLHLLSREYQQVHQVMQNESLQIEQETQEVVQTVSELQQTLADANEDINQLRREGQGAVIGALIFGGALLFITQGTAPGGAVFIVTAIGAAVGAYLADPINTIVNGITRTLMYISQFFRNFFGF